MRPIAPVVLAIALILFALPARAGECKVEAGPRDRVSKSGPLVIRSGEKVESAIAMHGDLTVESGAIVEKAIAVGGSVTLRSGARVNQDAVAVGGDVVLEAGSWVGHDTVSLGGQVREAKGSTVEGSVVGLAFQGGKSSLAKQILKGLGSLEGCTVSTKGGTDG